MMLTKESNSETSFELQVDMPPPIDIREQDPMTKEWAKRPGAVDTYRWMSFWLEPSVDATAAFFQQVVDPLWLQQSSDPDASVLRSLNESLKVERQDAKTKAWRVFHRCTYVSRVPERIESPAAAAAAASGRGPCSAPGRRRASYPSCPRMASPLGAGQEGLEPTTCGFGDRCSAN